ncbi:hypothetical protein CMUS01_08453 [Colletotrichum musicola]|uniref:Uncharacterized protein n=1 Tax=Colletotrichum musicola TaxID=2175873 RepID=A0A8H6KBV7_9PEZI|nr:hypothetical protein CMUS01_08453 [Colletotrichum musicola]
MSASASHSSNGVKLMTLENKRYNRLVNRAKRFASPNLQEEKESHNKGRKSGSSRATRIDLPSFGSLESYKVLPDTQEKLWRLEIERLAKIADDRKATMLLSKVNSGSESPLLARIDDEAFEDLRLRADDILDALHICSIDDQIMLMFLRNGLSLKARAKAQGKVVSCYRALRRNWDERARVGNLPGSKFVSPQAGGLTRAESYQAEDKEAMSATELREAQRLSLYLVDQIAATLAILGYHSKYWHAVVLACLAQLSTKLKVLLGNLDNNINNCLSTSYNHKLAIAEFDQVSSWLTECFTHALRGLGAQRPWWNKSSHLELCTMVYVAGVSGTRTIICQDRCGEISGSSASLAVSFLSKALALVGELGILLSERPRASTPSNITLEVELQRSDGGSIAPGMGSLYLHTVEELFVIATTLSLSHPRIGQRFEDSLNAISALPVVGTRDDIDDNPSNNTKSADKNPYYAFPPRSDQLRHPPSPSEIKSILLEAEKHRKNLETDIKRWNIAETSITISCPKYVYSVMLLSAILVTGGLFCGFLVGERVPGVDPFNFTMFSWIIGGFALLIAKSARVSDWPWRDFLMRQVTCRTVREVATVSGMDPQDILTFMFANERYSTLKLRGPFEAMFYEPSDSGGFSVDVKSSLQTLLASGIIPAVVSTLEGPATHITMRSVETLRSKENIATRLL